LNEVGDWTQHQGETEFATNFSLVFAFKIEPAHNAVQNKAMTCLNINFKFIIKNSGFKLNRIVYFKIKKIKPFKKVIMDS